MALVDIVRALESSLHEPLAGPRDRERLGLIAERIPSIWHRVGFECRLGVQGPVDLGIAVLPGLEDGILKRAEAQGGVWRGITQLHHQWLTPHSKLARWVPFLFLEYDANAAMDLFPIPSVFVAVDSPIDRGRTSPQLAAVRTTLETLRGQPLGSVMASRLVQCFCALPSTGFILHVGTMLGRPGDLLRVSVLVRREDAPAYLRKLDGNQAAEVATGALQVMTDRLTHVQMDLDLSPEVSTRIGFGCRPNPASGGSICWLPLLGELMQLGCCTEEAARAVVRWPGILLLESETSPPFAVQREISHLKLVCEPGDAYTAKCYLGARSISGGPGRSRTSTERHMVASRDRERDVH